MNAEDAREKSTKASEKKIVSSVRWMTKHIDKRIKEAINNASFSYTFTLRDVRKTLKTYDWIVDESIERTLLYYEALGYKIVRQEQLFTITWIKEDQMEKS